MDFGGEAPKIWKIEMPEEKEENAQETKPQRNFLLKLIITMKATLW